MKKGFLRKIKSHFSIKTTPKKVPSPPILNKSPEDKTLELMKETQKQITEGNLDQAKKTCKQAYSMYCKAPVEKQTSILSHLENIKERIKTAEKIKEKQEIEELAKDLSKLKSESEIYIIFDKSEVQKKLSFLTKYAQKVEEQGVHGLKAGKVHLKERLQELTESAKKIEKEEKKGFTPEEKDFLTKIKGLGTFFIKKEEALENVLKQKQKQLFAQLHILTRQTRIGLHPETNKKIIKVPQTIKPLPGLKPHTPPSPERYTEKKEALLEKARGLLTYLKNKQEEGVYQLRPAGKEFLDKIEAFVNTIKEKEQKMTPLKYYEEKFLSSLEPFMRKKEEKPMRFSKEEKNMVNFLEHMKEAGMIHVQEQKLQKEKEKLETEPVTEPPKIKIDVKRIKALEKEEEDIMGKIQKLPKKHLLSTQDLQKKERKRYSWEITADEIKKSGTKDMLNLLKEEKKLLSKLNKL